MFLRNYYYTDVGHKTACENSSVETTDSIEGRLHLIRDIKGNLIPTITGYGQSEGGETVIYNTAYMSNFVKANKSELVSDTSYRTSTSAPPYGVFFSNGTTPPTFNDYAPSGELFVTYTATCTRTFSFDEDGCEQVLNYTLTNTGTEDFTIGEVGLLTYARQKHKSYNRYYYYNIVTERTVLETPITIPAGGVGQITYKLRMNIPSA